MIAFVVPWYSMPPGGLLFSNILPEFALGRADILPPTSIADGVEAPKIVNTTCYPKYYTRIFSSLVPS
jgi:hypothetical protein